MNRLILFILSLPLAVFAAEPHGWRGDGTGRYPDANPPTTWERKAVDPLWAMRCSAVRPAANDENAGRPIAGQVGYITDWLILGPIAVPDAPAAIANPIIPNESEVRPTAGEKIGASTWTRLEAGPDINLTLALGKGENRACYLHTYLFSKAAGKVSLWTGAHNQGVKVWLNGKTIVSTTQSADGNGRHRYVVDVAPGWNSLLYKVTQGDKGGWSCSTWLSAAHPVSYETKNVAWMARLPGPSVSSPIIVGKKVFLASEPNELVCVDKDTGKVLWIRPTTLYDAATDDEKKSAGAKGKSATDKITEINDQLITQLNAGISKTGASTVQPLVPKQYRESKEKANHEIVELMKGVDPKKYKEPFKQDAGFTSPTPCSDGESVFVFYTNGIVAAFDLDGHRKWVGFENAGNDEHGNHYSPELAGDLVIFCMNKQVRAVNKKTGDVVWRQKIRSSSMSSPAVTKIGNEHVILTGNGTLLRASDGQPIGEGNLFQNAGTPTPIIESGVAYAFGSGCLLAMQLPASTDPKAEMKQLWKVPLFDHDLEREFGSTTTFEGGFVASPLFADGLIYLVSEGGFLIVLDAKTGESVYRKRLDLHPRVAYISHPGVAASPTLAGKYIYIMDNSGTCIVLSRGREPKVVARNMMENIFAPNEWNEAQEQLESTAVFEGKTMWIRGPEYLYCVRVE